MISNEEQKYSPALIRKQEEIWGGARGKWGKLRLGLKREGHRKVFGSYKCFIFTFFSETLKLFLNLYVTLEVYCTK